MQQSVIDGQPTVGVSTMRLVKRMDAGDVLLQAETPLGDTETYGELSIRLAKMGADLFMKTLDVLERGELSPVPQVEDRATYCKMLTRDSGKVDPNNLPMAQDISLFQPLHFHLHSILHRWKLP